MRFILITILACFFVHAFSQVETHQRKEYELDEGYSFEDLIGIREEKALLIQKNEESEKGEIEWRFSFLGPELEELESSSRKLPKKAELESRFFTESSVSGIWLDKKGAYTLISFSFEDLKQSYLEGEFPNKFNIEGLSRQDDFAFVIGDIKGNPLLFSIDLNTGEQVSVPIGIEQYKKKNIEVLGFQEMEDEKKTWLYSNIKVDKKTSKTFGTILRNGKKSDMVEISAGIPENIVDISASTLPNDKSLFFGTYSKDKVGESEGIFLMRKQGQNVEFFSTYNFLNLENFLAYLPEKKQEKIEKKKKKKEAKGKEYSVNYKMATHEIIPIDGGYILIGEAYHATTRPVTTSVPTTVNGVTTMRQQTTYVFDGYLYTHAFVAKFSDAGELVWDHSFELDPGYKPFVVKKFVAVSRNNPEMINLLYTNRNKIVFKSVDLGGKILQEKESSEISTGYEGAKSKKRASTRVNYWYDDYFLVFGEQKIVNKQQGELDDKRKVFFINKVSLK